MSATPDIPRQHTRRIEFDNRHEFANFDDHGGAVDPDETFPTVDSARSEIDYLNDTVDLGAGRAYRILWRPVPREWRVVAEEVDPLPVTATPRRREFMVVDQEGCSVGAAESYLTLAAARDEVEELRRQSANQEPTQTIVWRPAPTAWRALPDEEVGDGQG